MAYKDEYEVARLYCDGEFAKALQAQFDGDPGLKVLLAPPLLARRDKVTGHLQKREFGPWVFKAFGLLAKLKSLRGTALDIFGYTAERKMERALPGEYTAMIFRHLDGKPLDLPRLVALARMPEVVRGYGHIKEANVARYRAECARIEAMVGQPVGASGGVGELPMQFGIFDQNDRGPYPLSEQYEKRLALIEFYDRAGISHLAHERASLDAAQSDAVAERIPRRRHAAHHAHPPRRAGLCAADASSAAAR